MEPFRFTAFVFALITILLDVPSVVTQPGLIGGGLGSAVSEGGNYGNSYGIGFGNNYDALQGQSMNGAAAGTGNYGIAGQAQQSARQSICESYACLEWVNLESSSVQSNEGVIYGQQGSFLDGSLTQGASGAFLGSASSAVSQNFLDTYGWGPLNSQSATGATTSSGVGENAFGGFRWSSAGSGDAGVMAGAAKVGFSGADKGMRCKAFRCVRKGETSVGSMLGPNFNVGYQGTSGVGTVADTRAQALSGVGTVGTMGGYGNAGTTGGYFW